MSDWDTYTLGQITEPVKDGYKPNANDVRAYIGLEHIEQEKLRLNSIGSSQEITSNKFRFCKGDILFGKLRPYFRKVYQPKFDGVCSTDIWVFRPKAGFSSDWLFYFLADWGFVNLANGGDGGTRMPRADWAYLKDTTWSAPSYDEQISIAQVLRSLDDKIDLLHRQNKTLGEMTAALFKQLAQSNNETWDEVSLEDICVIRNGYAFKSETYQNDGQKIIRTLNFVNGVVELNNLVFITDALAKSFDGYWLQRKDFLLVMVGAGLGNFAIVTENILPALQNQNMWCFRAKRPYFQHYLNYALRPIINNSLQGAGGSARSFFQKGNFYKLKTKKPPEEMVLDFNEQAEPIFQRIELNRRQICLLEKLRDSLLPKLMSGEVRVRA